MVADEIQQYFGLPADKLAVIYNGVDARRFTPAWPASATPCAPTGASRASAAAGVCRLGL